MSEPDDTCKVHVDHALRHVGLLVLKRHIAENTCIQDKNVKLPKRLDCSVQGTGDLVFVCEVLWNSNSSGSKLGNKCI